MRGLMEQLLIKQQPKQQQQAHPRWPLQDFRPHQDHAFCHLRLSEYDYVPVEQSSL